MAKLVVVQNDKVEGTDKHNVSGNATNPAPPPPTVPYTGIGDFDYKGKMTDGLSDFVSIGGKPVATVDSKSSLNPGQTALGGGHHPTGGKNWLPPQPVPIPTSLSILDPVGEGRPSAVSGSAFVSVGGKKLLLDGDKIDTCDGLAVPMNSTVTAEGQSFVSCSA